MKRYLWIAAAAVLMLSTTCVQAKQKPPERTAALIGAVQSADQADESEEENNKTLFPRFEFAFVGDTMPFYDDGKMNIFYLADQRDGKTGYHPWALMRTEDYCNYEDLGIVIPYAESAQQQDIALGTGCVIKGQDGLYHAFYTGHNDFYAPKEAIMHATSNDLLNWTKIPEDTFTSGGTYSDDDFRDPYVFYVESEGRYWMLVVTRYEKNGVIVKYTSDDLHTWKDEGVLFEDDMGYGTNMECPSLLKYKDKWYLAFSDQWPDRVVHYRVSDSVSGPFLKPEKDTWDGNGFYAGRLETDGENLYVVGWNATKIKHDDANDYDWAGNVVVHQLSQQPDGTLKPVVNTKVVDAMSHSADVDPVAMTETVKKLDHGYQFSGESYELVQYEAFDTASRIEAEITGYDNESLFGISYAPDMENAGMLTYLFDVKEGRIGFYNTNTIFDADPQSYMDFDFSSGDPLRINILISDGVATLYVNDEIALTARMYQSQGLNWEFYSIKSDVSFDNIRFFN